MDINNSMMLRAADFQAYREVREARRAERLAELQEVAPAQKLEQMSEAEKAQNTEYLNASLNAAELLSEAKYSSDLGGIFPWPLNDKIIEWATAKKACDNDEAVQVKKEYKELYLELKKGLSHAQMLEKKLGPGTHQLTDKNGKIIATVHITKDKSGNVTVSLVKPDGSKEECHYNEKNPGDVRIEKTDKNGKKETLERKGTTCTSTKDGVTTSYSVDEQGRPVREKKGPGADDSEKTVVNNDGSTDDYQLIYYDDNNQPVYEHTHKDPKETKYQDAGAGKAIEALKKQNPNGQISADQMYKLIIDATADYDNQAAGKEYEDLKKFVQANEKRLSPDAKAMWEVYDKYVQEAKKKGQTGIDAGEYEKMKKEMKEPKYQDAGAGKAIEALKKQNPNGQISADQMYKLIIDATADYDNQAAGKEYEDLKKFVQANEKRLSPDAKAMWEVYDKYVQEAKKKGQTGIDAGEYEKMKKEMKEARYHDVGAGKAIEALKEQNPNGQISADQMYKLIIDATADYDNQAAGKEYEDLKKFVQANEKRLSPDAKAMWEVYDKYVQEAKKKGQTGIDAGEYEKMKKEMKEARYHDVSAGKAIEALKEQNPKDQITGDQMYKLIIDGISDPDNQAAGNEYDDLMRFIDANESRLSPEAKAKWQVYEKYAEAARAKGETGLSGEDYQKMINEMKAAWTLG